jgi:phage regulator Rha-like protein
MDELRHLVNEYRKIESNLNQIAKYFNTGGESSSDYMDKPHEHEAGFKHRSTTRFLNHLKKEVIKMCNREGLRQVNLLSPAPAKITR